MKKTEEQGEQKKTEEPVSPARPIRPAEPIRPAGPVRLRPHHGMCLAYYEGKGYSEGFSGHMWQVLHMLEGENPDVELTLTADEICSACPNDRDGRCVTDEKVKQYDREVLRCSGLHAGELLAFADFAAIVQEKILAAGLREKICGDCQWDEICRNRAGRFGK